MPFDPFRQPEPDEAQAEEVVVPDEPAAVVPPKKEAPAVVTPVSSGKMTVTFKGNGGFDSPWIVIYADDAEDAYRQVTDPSLFKLVEATKRVGEGWAGLYGAKTAPAREASSQGANKPAEATTAPNGQKKFCRHGEMDFKSGISKKTNKPYSLFSCTGPREEQCDAQWPDK